MNPPVWRLEPVSERQFLLHLSGDWEASGLNEAVLQPLSSALSEVSGPFTLKISATSLGAWDALLVAELSAIGQRWTHSGGVLDLSALPQGLGSLLGLAQAVPPLRSPARPVTQSRLGGLGLSVQRLGADFGVLNRFIGELCLSFFRFIQGRARYRRLDLVLQIQDCGPSAVPIVSLISLLVGLILAFVGAVQLALFGAELYIADLVALGMVREMGALMTAILMAGRSGAAFAAQIGTMQVNMEIPALKVMGFSALDFLVMPRVLALTLVMPLLGLYADLLGIAGGALVAMTFFDLPLQQFINRTAAAVDLYDFFIGVFKCGLFGFLIAVAGCMRGLQCGRTASAVGDASTSAVVTGIVMIVIADSVVTLICNRLDI